MAASGKPYVCVHMVEGILYTFAYIFDCLSGDMTCMPSASSRLHLPLLLYLPLTLLLSGQVSLLLSLQGGAVNT